MSNLLIELPLELELPEKQILQMGESIIRLARIETNDSLLAKINEDTVITVLALLEQDIMDVLTTRATNNREKTFIVVLPPKHYKRIKWLKKNLIILPLSHGFLESKYENLIILGLVLREMLAKLNESHEMLQYQLKELSEIGIALSSEKNLDILLDMILTEVRKFTNADAGSLYIKESSNLVFEVAQNDSIDKKPRNESSFKKFSVPISSKSIAGHVALTKEPLNIKDVYKIDKSSSFQHDKGFDKKFDYRTKSILTFPMMDNQDEVIGVLQIINALDDLGVPIPFSNTLERLVESLGSQAAVAIKNTKLIEEIQALLISILEYTASLIDARSRHTAGHSHRVAHLVIEIARGINAAEKGYFKDITFSQDQLQELNSAALLHDVGKIGIPEAVLDKHFRISLKNMDAINWRIKYTKSLLIMTVSESETIRCNDVLITHDNVDDYTKMLDELWKVVNEINECHFLSDEYEILLEDYKIFFVETNTEKFLLLTQEEYENLRIKKGNLTEREREIINSHINLTCETLEKIPFPPHLSKVPDIAGMHHEKLDGTGYPKGLKGDEIPLQSRILAIADFIDALSAKDRPYRSGFDLEKTMNILMKEAKAGKFDHNLSEFIKEGLEREQIIFPWYIIVEKE